MIEFKSVTKVYDNDVLALSDVNIKIDKGDFVFLVGSSGSGKSTFIKSLLKEVDVTEGNILVNNVDVTGLKGNDIAYYRRNIGVIFQDFRLIPTLNVYENIAFAMRVVESSPDEMKEKIPKVLHMVGLSSKYNAFPDELSGGEQQRVAIARAIVNDPALIIADEPTGNLDPDTALEIMDILNDINRAGTTILMATHAKDIVNAMQKRVIVVKNGKIKRDEQKGRYDYED